MIALWQCRFCCRIHLDIGSAKPIDALLGVAYEEEPSRLDGHLMPDSLILRVTGCEVEDDLSLQRICILEFVNKHVFVMGSEVACHIRRSLEHLTRKEQEVMEIEHTLPALETLVFINETCEGVCES